MLGTVYPIIYTGLQLCIYIHFVLVYDDGGFGYLSTVQEIAQKAMADARSEVQGTHNYAVNGDVSNLS